MKILILNQDWFAAELRERGHTVWTAGHLTPHLEIKIERPFVHLDTIIEQLPGDARPDVIVVHDNSSPLVFVGLDETTIPTLFYSVDAHHHSPFHKYLGLVFDATLVAQRDYLPEYRELDPDAAWLPLWASRFVEPAKEKKYPVAFVGTLNKKLNPDRVEFFEALQKRVPIHIHSGQWWPIFAASEIVINQTVKGDLNFRVFEAMMSGACLLTERSGNGLLELFREGQEIVTYQKGSAREAEERISSLLADRTALARIADAGRAEILRAHLPRHRAEQLEQILVSLKKRRAVGGRFGYMANFAILGRRLLDVEKSHASHAFLCALRVAEAAHLAQDRLYPELANYLVIATHFYDVHFQSQAGFDLLERIGETMPELGVLGLARIRARLNRGDLAGAQALARRLFASPPEEVFAQGEAIIAALLMGEVEVATT